MMKNLWVYNDIISVVIVTWFLAQLVKFIILFVKKRKINFKIFISSGGMPSAHSAVVSALALSVGISQGFHSAIFALSFVFAIIVIYDALGVRRAAGAHARALNKIIPRVLKKEDGIRHFKTGLGHELSEVLIGVLLGLTVPLILMWNKINLPNQIKFLFKFSYLFNLNPGSNFRYLIPLLILFGLVVLGGIILIIISWRIRNLIYKKLFSKIYTLLLTIGILGLIYLFFRYENIYFLSSRFLLLFLFLTFIIWSGFIIHYGMTKFPSEIKDYQELLRKEKYIPKAKNH